MRAGTDRRSDLVGLTPEALRAEIRRKHWDGSTAGLALGYAQANLVILPQAVAYDFLLFCQRNPKPCPLLEVTEPGQWHLSYTAKGADLRTDVPRYRIFHDGQFTEEMTDVTGIWREDFVSFLLGCSFTFEAAMMRAGLPVRHLDEGHNVPMYRTTSPCRPAGGFAGGMVVSMRPVALAAIPRVIQVTGRYPLAHGAPVHIGDPLAIGIADISNPDFGQADTMHEGEVPVFWACGVTPQVAAQHAKPPIMITHAPGHMFVTDVRDEDLAIW
jgi:uncharacterized protein YcsI (UPF0317 family)